MDLDSEHLRIDRDEDGLVLVMENSRVSVHRVARAFPSTEPDRYVSFLDEKGHEIGLLDAVSTLDESSREILQEELRRIYFVPLIETILSVERQGTGTLWRVTTDDGEKEFRVQSRDMLDGREAPGMTISDSAGKRYRIDDYWLLDREGRNLIKDMIPDKVLRTRLLARKGKGAASKAR